MSIALLLTELEKLCYDLQDWNGSPSADNIRSRIKAAHRKAVLESTWIQKNAFHRIPTCVFLSEAVTESMKDDLNGVFGLVNEAQGRLEQAVRIDKEEREKGVPKPFKQEGTIEDNGLEFLDDAVDLNLWLEYFGEGVVGPSWWMDNLPKNPTEWSSEEIRYLSKRLIQSEDGKLLDDNKHVFRYLGKGSFDRGEWLTTPDGQDDLFAVFSLENDPGRITKEIFHSISLDIDLERWLDLYGQEEHPARMMCSVDNRKDQITLQKQLRELDGVIVNGTHVWRALGKRTYGREGQVNLFKCQPI